MPDQQPGGRTDDISPEQECVCQLCGVRATQERDGWKNRKHLGWVCSKHSDRLIRSMQSFARPVRN